MAYVEVTLDDFDYDDILEYVEEKGDIVISETDKPDTDKEKLNAIRDILQLREWHTKKDIIKEIQEL